MRTFIFEKYGYYPDEMSETSFTYRGWLFTLTPSEHDEVQVGEINRCAQGVQQLFPNSAAQLVRNRQGAFLSFDGEQQYVLWAVPEGKQTLEGLKYFHSCYRHLKGNESLDLDDLLTLWEEKFDFVEHKVLSSIRSDEVDYMSVLEGIYFAFGLAENALQYLADAKLDYGNKLGNHTLVHKRLSSLQNEVFFDPFNYIIDHPIRDLAELYKADMISSNELMPLLDYYQLTQQEASFLMARVMFPTRLFDVLERHYMERKDTKKEILAYRIGCERELMRVNNLHYILLRKYSIRPLTWLT